MDIPVVATGTANTASVLGWLARAGLAPRLTRQPKDVRDAALLVLPGVGTFGAAMRELSEAGLVEPLRARIAAGRPLLAICLGMQILFDSSEESPGVPGLGVIPGVVRRLDAPRVPNMGWCPVTPDAPCAPLPSGAAYFANSYACAEAPSGWTCARTGSFISALSRSRVLACQFHPELSSHYGRDLLQRWLRPRGETTPAAQAGDSPNGPYRRVIPCLDVRSGRVVKGVRFANLRDAGDPAACAAAYEAQGADELVILDVSATPEQRGASLDTVRAVRAAISIPLTVGGGVRSAPDASALLDAGADKVALNTAAVADPSLISTLAARYGSQCTVVAIDAASNGASWSVVTRSGTHRTALDAVEWASEAAARGAGELLLTSFDRDGTGHGYDLALLRAVRAAVTLPIIASGGASSPRDLATALEAGADAALAASIFHDDRFTVGDVKAVLAARGLETRP